MEGIPVDGSRGLTDVWHVDQRLLTAYAAGQLDDAARWSVEAHVTHCDRCRQLTRQGEVVAGERLDAIWQQVAAEVDAPSPRLVERGLLAVGVPDALARLLAATPSLTASWLLAVAAVVAVTVAVAWVGPESPLLFFATAPLLPLAGVAAAFGPGIDPTYEIGLAAPLRSGRLLLVRAVAVTTTSLLVAGLGALALPTLGWQAAAFILPSLATTTLMLAASTWLPPLAAAGGVAATWVGLVTVVEVRAAAPLAAFTESAQVTALVLAAAAVVAVTVRRRRFDVGVGL